jgi:hypothetical protein
MANTLCKILGVVLILIGITGFVYPNLLGMHLTQVHNIIHLVSGVLALYFGFFASWSAARTFSIIFGAVYLLLGIIGFVAPEVVASIIQTHDTTDTGVALSTTPTTDNIVHLILGAIFLVAGLVGSSQTRPIPTEGGSTTQ